MAPGHSCNFLYDLPLLDYTRLRAAIIDLVLATDMKQHFSILGQAKGVRFHRRLQRGRLAASSACLRH